MRNRGRVIVDLHTPPRRDPSDVVKAYAGWFERRLRRPVYLKTIDGSRKRLDGNGAGCGGPFTTPGGKGNPCLPGALLQKSRVNFFDRANGSPRKSERAVVVRSARSPDRYRR